MVEKIQISDELVKKFERYTNAVADTARVNPHLSEEEYLATDEMKKVKAALEDFNEQEAFSYINAVTSRIQDTTNDVIAAVQLVPLGIMAAYFQQNKRFES